MDWQKGEPEKSGYYLVAWRKNSAQIVVSELWFNPEAIYHWWFSRGYIDEHALRSPLRYAMKNKIIGWMPMPDPPRE